MRFLTFIVLIFLGVSPAWAQSSKIYQVKVGITFAGVKVGEPSLAMEAGSTAVMTSTGDNGYSIKALLGDDAGGTASSLPVTVELYRAQAGRWILIGRPSVTVELGRSATVSTRMPTGGQALLEFSVQPRTSPETSKLQGFGQNKCDTAKLASWDKAMASPIVLKAALMQHPSLGCCSPCSAVTCCSSGPMCCSDSTNCGSSVCCNY